MVILALFFRGLGRRFCGVGGRAYPDIGWAKLKVMAEGAALASKKLWAK